MQKYELLVVLPGTLDDAEAKKRMDEVMALVGQYGQDAELHPLGKNRLAYPIKHIRYGYFNTIVFNAEAPKVKELEAKLAISRDVLRSMVTHFNTTLTASQRIVYSTDSLGLTTMIERPAYNAAPGMAPTAAPVAVQNDTLAASAAQERKLDAQSMEEITKKLDDLMSGDVLPNV
jgi:ribosomal protein S6